MKTYIAFYITSLFLMGAAANASVVENGHLRLYRFNFSCHFGDEVLTGDSSHGDETFGNELILDEPGRKCTAAATVYAFVDPDDWMTTLEAGRGGIENKLAVRCGDELLYADSAILDPSNRRFVRITGINGSPLIDIKRNEHEKLTTMSQSYKSYLNIRHDRLRGECEVRNEPVRE